MNLRRALTILLSIACVTVYVVGFLLYQRHKAYQYGTEQTKHSHYVIIQTQNMHSSIEKLIATQRGYLLSQNRDFYTSYFDAVTYLENELQTLKTMTEDNPVQQERIDLLQNNIVQLRQLLEEKIILRQQNPTTYKVDITGNIVKVKLIAENVRRIVTDLVSEEQKLLALRQDEARNREMSYLYALFIVSFISVFILIAANGLILGMAMRHRTVSRNLTQSEQDLMVMRERFELAMRGTSDGIFDWNAEIDEIYFSPRFCGMLGYTTREFPATTTEFKELIHPDDVERVVASVFACLDGGDDYYEQFRIQHKDGSWHWHLARGATTAPRGQKGTRLVGAHTDITQQKTAEEELRASNKELEEFTYIASHDLRAPLVNLKGFASEIEFAFHYVQDFVKKYLPDKSEEHEQEIISAIETDIPQSINFIRHSVTKMEKLTRAILELSRVGRRRFEYEPLHTAGIVENCLTSLHHDITQKNVTVNVGPLPSIKGDSVAIEQVFMNIIDNAVKYASTDREPVINISATRNVSETTFAIEDNGRGIRQEDIGKVFEIFKRAGNNSDIPGEGMGMAYVQTIIRRHGGTIWCTSELGKGSRFYFSIPHHIEKGNDDA